MKNTKVSFSVIDIMAIDKSGEGLTVGDINLGGFCGESYTGRIIGASQGGGFYRVIHFGGIIGDTPITN